MPVTSERPTPIISIIWERTKSNLGIMWGQLKYDWSAEARAARRKAFWSPEGRAANWEAFQEAFQYFLRGLVLWIATIVTSFAICGVMWEEAPPRKIAVVSISGGIVVFSSLVTILITLRIHLNKINKKLDLLQK